jgi:isoleucyl-tRNA synthetase
MRKEAGFAVSDRILLTVEGTAEARTLVETHGEWIAAEVLATELVAVERLSGEADTSAEVALDGLTARVAITRTA